MILRSCSNNNKTGKKMKPCNTFKLTKQISPEVAAAGGFHFVQEATLDVA